MFKFGDIVLVPFPFTDLSSAKLRPALVVSKDGGIGDDVIVCFITSNLTKKVAHQLVLESNNHTGLKVQSAVRFHRIATLRKSIIVGKLGYVDQTLLQKHRSVFAEVFGF